MIELEKVESKLKFGDLVRVKSENEERYIYAIYINENEEYYNVTDYKFIIKWRKINKIERIGSVIDENIINLLKKGDE